MGLRTLTIGLAFCAIGCAGQAAGPRSIPARPSGQPAPALATSVFDRPWIWSDERDAPVRLSRWRGTPLVVGFVYTTCATVCPMTIDRLRQLARSYQQAGRAVEFVLVTLDPLTDSSEQLRTFRSSRRLPPEWHLLRASFPQTRALADLLQVRLIDDGSHVIHDGTVALVAADGRSFGHLPD